MADEAVAVTQTTFNTVTADLLTDTEGGTSIAAGDTGVITTNEANAIFLTLYNASGGATVTIAAGDYPPSAKAGIATSGLAITVPAGDCVGIVLDASRFTQDNGTIRAAVATNAVIMAANKMPVGSGS